MFQIAIPRNKARAWFTPLLRNPTRPEFRICTVQNWKWNWEHSPGWALHSVNDTEAEGPRREGRNEIGVKVSSTLVGVAADAVPIYSCKSSSPSICGHCPITWRPKKTSSLFPRRSLHPRVLPNPARSWLVFRVAICRQRSSVVHSEDSAYLDCLFWLSICLKMG